MILRAYQFVMQRPAADLAAAPKTTAAVRAIAFVRFIFLLDSVGYLWFLLHERQTWKISTALID